MLASLTFRCAWLCAGPLRFTCVSLCALARVLCGRCGRGMPSARSVSTRDGADREALSTARLVTFRCILHALVIAPRVAVDVQCLAVLRKSIDQRTRARGSRKHLRHSPYDKFVVKMVERFSCRRLMIVYSKLPPCMSNGRYPISSSTNTDGVV